MKDIIEQKRALAKAEAQGLQGASKEDVRLFVGGVMETIKNHAPNLDTSRLSISFFNTIYKTKEILNCDISTVIGAIYQSVVNNLDPSNGECYFIPRKVRTAQGYVPALNFEIGYQGYLKIYEGLGYIIDVQLVNKADDVRQEPLYTQSGWKFEYVPKEAFPTRDTILYAFATAIYPNGEKKSILVSIDEIEKMRMKSPNQNGKPSGVWLEWYGEMAKKSAVRRLRKWIGAKTILPDNEGIIRASEVGIEIDNELDDYTEINEQKEWEMTKDLAIALYKSYVEKKVKESPEMDIETIKSDYLQEIELLTGSNVVKNLTEEQYNKLIRSFQ